MVIGIGLVDNRCDADLKDNQDIPETPVHRAHLSPGRKYFPDFSDEGGRAPAHESFFRIQNFLSGGDDHHLGITFMVLIRQAECLFQFFVLPHLFIGKLFR